MLSWFYIDLNMCAIRKGDRPCSEWIQDNLNGTIFKLFCSYFLTVLVNRDIVEGQSYKCFSLSYFEAVAPINRFVYLEKVTLNWQEYIYYNINDIINDIKGQQKECKEILI